MYFRDKYEKSKKVRKGLRVGPVARRDVPEVKKGKEDKNENYTPFFSDLKL